MEKKLWGKGVVWELSLVGDEFYGKRLVYRKCRKEDVWERCQLENCQYLILKYIQFFFILKYLQVLSDETPHHQMSHYILL